ncbi:MAG: hypothetical protein ABR579_10940 [Actinomycetota bacterium]
MARAKPSPATNNTANTERATADVFVLTSFSGGALPFGSLSTIAKSFRKLRGRAVTLDGTAH